MVQGRSYYEKTKTKALISGITLSTVGVGITSYLLSDAAKRRKVKGLVRSAKVKLSSLSKTAGKC